MPELSARISEYGGQLAAAVSPFVGTDPVPLVGQEGRRGAAAPAAAPEVDADDGFAAEPPDLPGEIARLTEEADRLNRAADWMMPERWGRQSAIRQRIRELEAWLELPEDERAARLQGLPTRGRLRAQAAREAQREAFLEREARRKAEREAAEAARRDALLAQRAVRLGEFGLAMGRIAELVEAISAQAAAALAAAEEMDRLDRERDPGATLPGGEPLTARQRTAAALAWRLEPLAGQVGVVARIVPEGAWQMACYAMPDPAVRGRHLTGQSFVA